MLLAFWFNLIAGLLNLYICVASGNKWGNAFFAGSSLALSAVLSIYLFS